MPNDPLQLSQTYINTLVINHGANSHKEDNWDLLQVRRDSGVVVKSATLLFHYTVQFTGTVNVMTLYCDE